ncbi:ankyrin repeat-containing domain protein [Aspergillus aurantiobrunneus]
MSFATLPTEILQEVIHPLAHSWRNKPSWTTNTRARRKPVVLDPDPDLFWFLSLRLVSKRLDEIITEHFITAIKAEPERIDEMSAIRRGPPTKSTLAMRARVLRSLARPSLFGFGPAARSPYPIVNAVVQGTQAAVRVLAGPDEGRGALQREYFDALSVVIAANFHMDLMTPKGWGGDGDYEWCNAIPMAAAYLGRIDHMDRVLAEGAASLDPRPANLLYPPVMAAALGGRMEVMRFLGRRGVSLDRRMMWDEENVFNAVHFAALGGHADVVAFLIENRAEAHLGNENTPLLWAAGAGHADVVRELMPVTGVFVDTRDSLGRTPLMWAVDRGHEDVVVELLKSPNLDLSMTDGDAGIDNVPVLGLAAAKGRESIFHTLFTHPRGEDMLTFFVIHHALVGKSVGIMRLILDRAPKALESYKQQHGTPAIVAVADEGTEEMLRYLLSREDINVNEPNTYGETALRAALKSGDIGKFRALLEHPELDVNLVTDYHVDTSWTALDFAAWSNMDFNPEILKAFLARPDLNVNTHGDEYNTTPLASAAMNGNVRILSLLFAHDRVDKVPVDTLNCTPLMLAAESGKAETFDILLTIPETWTDIWRRNTKNQTMLELSARSGHLSVVQRLLDLAMGVTREILGEALDAVEGEWNKYRQADPESESSALLEKTYRTLKDRLDTMD